MEEKRKRLEEFAIDLEKCSATEESDGIQQKLREMACNRARMETVAEQLMERISLLENAISK